MPVRLPFEHCVADLEKRSPLGLSYQPKRLQASTCGWQIERMLSVAPSILPTLLAAAASLNVVS
jgi:hypothetical protein